MTDKNNLLVEAPEGLGSYLNTHKPPQYVSGRPYSAKNSPQLQLASAQKALVILGETKLTDEEFAKAYAKDPEAAIKDAVIKTGDMGKAAVDKSAKAAKAAKAEKLKVEASEKERVAKEAAVKAADEAKLKAEKAKG